MSVIGPGRPCPRCNAHVQHIARLQADLSKANQEIGRLEGEAETLREVRKMHENLLRRSWQCLEDTWVGLRSDIEAALKEKP